MKNETNYTNIYGSYDKQLRDFSFYEKELFFRRIVLAANFSKQLKKYNIILSLKIDHEYKKINFHVSSPLVDERSVGNTSYALLLNLSSFKVPANFLEKNNDNLNNLFCLEERLDYSNYVNKYPKSTNKEELLNIDGKAFQWAEAIFISANLHNDYSKFLSFVLNNKLDKKTTGITAKIKKI